MRTLVIGQTGQLAHSLAERGAGREVWFLDRDALDLSRPDSIGAVVRSYSPDIIINAAAYTAVDRAEDEPELTDAINARAPGEIAEVAAQTGARLIHISTDYVFDGKSRAPYRETDPVAPLGSYGRSKLAGEMAVIGSGADAIIARTAWVYSPFGSNFVKTMLRLAGDRDEVGVVADQIGSPTSALDLADALWRMADDWTRATAALPGRIVHAAGTGQASWADVAEAIFATSAQHGGPTAQVRRISTAQFPTRAARPGWSVLSGDALTAAIGQPLPEWRASLEAVVSRLVAARP